MSFTIHGIGVSGGIAIGHAHLVSLAGERSDEARSCFRHVEELLARPEETCQRAIDYVLKKNAELYRRLA